MFKVGQRVVCINDKGRTQVKEDVIYTVLDIDYCCEQGIYVGYKIAKDRQSCQKCGKVNGYCGEPSFAFSARFAPIEEMEKAESAVNKLIEEVKQPEEILI